MTRLTGILLVSIGRLILIVPLRAVHSLFRNISNSQVKGDGIEDDEQSGSPDDAYGTGGSL